MAVVQGAGRACEVRLAAALLAPLAGCSYYYEVSALLFDGPFAFAADPWRNPLARDCVGQFSVERDDGQPITADEADDETRTGYGTVWFQIIRHEDACANVFPIRYAEAFAGRFDARWRPARAKPLELGVNYTLLTTTGATGHGGGRFVIGADGSIKNL